ncbi:MAG TPA: heavy metal translocating P-type ATPase [Pseudomonadales bacterium]|nr:heavy metal translocating P-type ATPase [Pseudomonadales bacterium]
MTVACFHCGLPVPPGSRFLADIDGESRAMCCAGCAAVASLIAGSGLAGYYRHRDTAAAAPADAGAGAAEYAVFDAEDAQGDFVLHEDDGYCRAQLAIDGINCAACTWLIEHHLQRQPGVAAISVNLAEQRASVRWRPGELPLSQLMGRIRELGYRPYPFLASGRAETQRAENRSALKRMGLAGIVQMQIGMFAIALYAGDFAGMEADYRAYLRWASLVLCVPVVAYSSAPFFSGALRGLRHGAPGMDLPIALAIALAFGASVWFTVAGGGAVYYDSVAMFTFFVLLGRYLEMRARHRAGLAGGTMLSLVPAAATRVLEGGERHELVPVGRLRPGDLVLIRPGEAIPADGAVLGGESSVDESSISGESLPVAKAAGDRVSAGTLNTDGSLTVQVQATGMNSRLGAILALVDRAQQEKPAIVQLADRSSRWFVLAVILVSVLTGLWWLQHEPARVVEIVLSVLVVSCPCALSLATPAAMTAATAALRARGFLVTRGHALDGLAAADTVVFDKTGTLTTGEVKLAEVRTTGERDAASCLRIAASLEALSEHPIAAAFAEQARDPVEAFRAHPGGGLEGVIDGRCYRLGRPGFALAGDAPAPPEVGKWILLACDGQALAWFRLTDTLRADATGAIAALRRAGLGVALLSGDAAGEVQRVATQLGVDEWRAGCVPEQKLAAVRELQASGRRVVMVGDGINDVAVLAGAAVSIAMANAADVTRANADCMLLAGDLRRIPDAILMARRARHVIRQNIAWAIVYNFAAVPFAAAGLVPPWLAAIGMSASSLVVIANALRLRNDAPASTSLRPAGANG